MKINQKKLRNTIKEAIEGVVNQSDTNSTLEPFASVYKNMYSQESVNEFNKLLFNNFPVLNQNGKICYRYKQDNGCYVYLIDDRNEHFKYDLTEDDWWWYRKIEGEYRAFYKWVLVQKHPSYFPMLTNNNSAKALSSLILYLNPKSKIANANYCMQQNTDINENKTNLTENTNKTVMKINESQLRQIIKESLIQIISEGQGFNAFKSMVKDYHNYRNDDTTTQDEIDGMVNDMNKSGFDREHTKNFINRGAFLSDDDFNSYYPDDETLYHQKDTVDNVGTFKHHVPDGWEKVDKSTMGKLGRKMGLRAGQGYINVANKLLPRKK